MLRRLIATGLVLGVAATACGGEAGSPLPEAAVVDSAGVRIVTHPAGAPGDTVPLEPILIVGRDGDPDYEFFRIAGVEPLGSGNLVVANGGTRELLFFGSEGTLIRRVGGRGDGPAELGFLSDVHHLAGDTLVAVDSNRRRLVYFDSAGTFVRGESFAQYLGDPPQQSVCVFPGLAGLLEDDARLIVGWGCMMLEGSDGPRPTMTSLDLARPSRRDTLASFDFYTVWERGSAEDVRESFAIIPFGPVARWATGRSRVFLTFGVEYDIRIFDDQGSLSTILREERVPREVTERDREAYRRELLELERPPPQDVPFPERFGAYGQLVVSYEGELWAPDVDRPSSDVTRWSIFSRDGETLRQLLLPAMTVHAVRGGKIYGHLEDDLGVERVVVLEMPES